LVKAVYLAGNSYPHDRHLEERVIELLASRLGIGTIPQSKLIPHEPPFSLYPLDPAVREQTLSAFVEALDEPIILIGRSSGALTITNYAKKNPNQIISCICFAYPFQAVGHPPEDWRTKHLQTLATPTLIIQGTRDRYGSAELTTRFDLNPHTDVLYVDADHESDYHSQDWTRIGTEIEKLINKITKELVKKPCNYHRSCFDSRSARPVHPLPVTKIEKHEQVERNIPTTLPKGFEASAYLRLNPDVAHSGMSAEDHYRFHGKHEGRNYLITLPKDFEAQTYLALNPDVAQAGVAADLHYAVYGVKENRRYRHA